MASNALKTLLNRVEQFRDNINVYVRDIILDNEAFIVDMNAQIQLFEQGINSLGVDISDYMPYSPLTIEIKKEKGQPYDRVTLRDEGDFEASFYLDADLFRFEIKAGDWKTEELMKKYGTQILGLTEDHVHSVTWDYIYPDLLKKEKEVINGRK